MITTRLRKSEWRYLMMMRRGLFDRIDPPPFPRRPIREAMQIRLFKRGMLQWDATDYRPGYKTRVAITQRALDVLLDHPPHWGLQEGPANCH